LQLYNKNSEALRQIRDANILQLTDLLYNEKESEVYMVLEYANKGPLEKLIESSKWTPEELRDIFI